MIAVLGVCRKDVELVARWLEWANELMKPDPCGNIPDQRLRLIVTLTRDIDEHGFDRLRKILRWEQVVFRRLPDLQERGYPGSASHLFVRSLEIAGEIAPGQPILWLEPDAIPIEDGWFTAIEEEYLHCGMPFMGHLELKAKPPHMAGVGVYPHDWHLRAPSIRGTLTAPDHHAWGPGCGQAWDMWAGKEILPQAAQSRTIQQVWRCEDPSEVIWTTTKLFHQSKDGKLIELLRDERKRSNGDQPKGH